MSTSAPRDCTGATHDDTSAVTHRHARTKWLAIAALSNVVQRLVHLDDARTPRLLNGSYEDFRPEPRRIARFVPRPLDSRRTLPTLTTGAGVRPQRPSGLAATSGACAH